MNNIKNVFKNIKLRTRSAIYFTLGFSFIWTLLSVFLAYKVENFLLDAFDDQLMSQAELVAQKTSVEPRIVPLPQGEELFSIYYDNYRKIDTLYATPKIKRLENPESNNKKWRSVTFKRNLENGGSLIVNYYLPADPIYSKINAFHKILLTVLFFGIVIAFLIANWLAKKLLKPINKIIAIANTVDLHGIPQSIKEPKTNDELKEIINSFNKMIARIKEQTDKQQTFFASASHELRTPLSIMKARLQVSLNEPKIDLEQKENLIAQLYEVERLNKMINDFLLMAELQNGMVKAIKSKHNLSDILEASISGLKHKATEKNLAILINFKPIDGYFEVYTDSERLVIIVKNLLENAIKYARVKSKIDIEIEQKDALIFRISNKIREDINPVISDIKNRFYHSKPLNGEGFGLGLWIANQLSEQLDIYLNLQIDGKRNFIAELIF
jgi:signal transduction histidine kinase